MGQNEPSVTTYLNRGTGYWYVNVYFASTGTRYRPSLGVKEESRVPQALELFQSMRLAAIIAKHEAQKAEAVTESGGGTRIRDVVNHYVDKYLPAKNAADSTITKAVQVLGEFERFCAGRHIGRVQQLTPATVDAWSAESRKTHKPKTTKGRLMMLQACLNAAVDRGMLEQSPVKKWLFPSVEEPEIWPLTEEQLARVLDIMWEKRPDVANVITWIALTGQRPSDARKLLWRHVDTKNCIVERTQTKVRRLATFEISEDAAACIGREREKGRKGDLVFLNDEGKPFTNNVLYNAITHALKAAGFERRCNLKDLRHTYCSLACNEWGVQVTEVQRNAGHSDIKMTMRYVHPGSSKEKLSVAHHRITENVSQLCHSPKKGRKSKQK